MTVFSTIHELLAGKPATAVAFVGSGCPSLTYGGLREHVERTVASLNRLGIGRNDRVALVLPGMVRLLGTSSEAEALAALLTRKSGR